MIDMKKCLTDQNSIKDYDDADIDPDKIVTRHKKAVAQARAALRDHLSMQLRNALLDFYNENLHKEQTLLS